MRLAHAISFVLLVLYLSTSWAASDATAIAKEAADELQYRVGKWQSDAFIDGVEQAQPGSETTVWAPGKYCIQHAASSMEDGVEIHATGITGWDADKKQLVEYWYDSDGGWGTFRYCLGQKKDCWIGTFVLVDRDDRKFEGDSIVEKKSQNEWQWNASYIQDGKKHAWRTVNRRVN